MSEFDHWKERLDAHESPVPDKLWEGVASAIYKKEDRRFFTFWLFGIGLVAIVLIYGWFQMGNYEGPQSENSPQFYQIAAEHQNKYADSLSQNQMNSIGGSSTTPQARDPKTDQAPVVENRDILSAKAKETIIKRVKGDDGNEATPLSDGSITSLISRRSNSSTDAYTQEVDADELLHEVEFMAAERLERLVEPLGTKGILTIEPRMEFVPVDRCDLPDPPLGCPKLGKRSGLGGGLSRWAFDLTYGPGYPLRSLAAKSSEFEDYVALRNTHETTVYDEMIQARVSYISKWGIAARTGLNYGHLVEKLAFIRDSVTGSTTTITIDTVFNPDGSISIAQDTLNVISSGRLEKVKYNHFTTLQVPIILGYEHRIKDWTFHLNGGVLMNIYLNRRGEILDRSDTPVDISSTTGTLDAFKDSWDMIVYGSLGVNYRIGERLHVLAEPSFRYTPNPITTAGYALNQKYLILNLNVGLRYEF